MLPPGGEGSELWMNWDRWNLEPRRACPKQGVGEFWVSGTEGELL